MSRYNFLLAAEIQKSTNPIYKSAWLEFSDNDSHGGRLGGSFIFTFPESSAQITEYALYWGNNPHQRLGMFRPLAVFPNKKPGSPNLRRVRLQFKALRVPPGATHFLLYAKSASGDGRKIEIERDSLLLLDKGVPRYGAQNLEFEQSGKEGNRIQGEIRLTRAWDERDVTHYAVYWGTAPDTVLRTQAPIAVIEKRSWYGYLWTQLQAPWRQIPLTIALDELLPAEATHLLAFSRNAEGQMSRGISVKLKSNRKTANSRQETAEENPALKMQFHKKPAESGKIAGEITLFRTKETIADLSHYLFFWGTDNRTRLENYPPLAQFEIRKVRDGLTDKEIQISTLTSMDQKLKISPLKQTEKTELSLKYEFPPNAKLPPKATHILTFTQQKFWFQDDAERRLIGPVANYELGIKTQNPKPKIANQKLKTAPEAKTALRQPSTSPNRKLRRQGQDWRISEYRGIGLGLSLSGLNGISTFYDHNLDDNRQWHFALEHTGPQAGHWYKTLRLTEESTDMWSIAQSSSGNTLEISRTLFSATYRWFVDESAVWGITDGFYYGTGGGLGYATFKYQGRDASGTSSISGTSESFNSTATDYRHSTVGYGLFGVIDAGWQGLENHFFHLAIQPSFYVLYQDGFEENKIPVNPNQRSTAKDRWLRAKDLIRIFLGFGLFF